MTVINFNYSKRKILSQSANAWVNPRATSSGLCAPPPSPAEIVDAATKFVLRGMHTQVYADFKSKGKLLKSWCVGGAIHCAEWADEMAAPRTLKFLMDTTNELMMKELKTARYSPPQIFKIVPHRKQYVPKPIPVPNPEDYRGPGMNPGLKEAAAVAKAWEDMKGHQWTELVVHFAYRPIVCGILDVDWRQQTNQTRTDSIRLKTETNCWYGNRLYKTGRM
jgi:hypothetical protein